MQQNVHLCVQDQKLRRQRQNVQGAKRLRVWGEKSRGRNVHMYGTNRPGAKRQGANRPGGETTRERNVQGPKRRGGETSINRSSKVSAPKLCTPMLPSI